MNSAPIRDALAGLAAGRGLREGAAGLFGALGYRSERTTDAGSVAQFLATFDAGDRRLTGRQRVALESWRAVEIVFQVTASELGAAQPELFGGAGFEAGRIESFLFLAAELEDRPWSRGALADMTRAVNRLFAMPAVVLFRSGGTVTLAVVHRRAHRRDTGRDVLERVTLVKDVRAGNPHRAHLEILAGLALPRLGAAASLDALHAAWERALDIETLNRRFYGELYGWFGRAVRECRFPDDGAGEGSTERHAIRLLVRLLFVWFVKEKGLVPEKLFEEEFARSALKAHAPERTDYYRAVLQNLFFATLNTAIDRRAFSGRVPRAHRDFDKYRYRALLADPEGFVETLRKVPFVNGGLFDCLDDFEGARAGGRRIDAFTDNPARGRDLDVPARLFFDADYGLFALFRRYKFTVEENTPLDREVALDPELLGRAFENLLAAYNPETRETARKATGSYYTPRPVVDYMVREALAEALAERASPTVEGGEFWRDRLRYLLDWESAKADAGDFFEPEEAEALVRAVAGLRVLDPAAGSGAFPMGVLQTLTLALRRLDPDNDLWEAFQKERAKARAGAAFETGGRDAREAELRDVNDTFERYKQSDFGRKLYLIQNGIYGVDVQPIACQIAKLRFFISLVIEQDPDPGAANLGIRPLPNLETRFVAADALLGLGAGRQGVLRSDEVQALEDELRRVRESYFNAGAREAKRRLRDRDKDLRAELARALEGPEFGPDDARAVAEWDPYDQNAHAGWFDPEWMFGVADGFDVVLGNPPYVRGEKIPGKARLARAFGAFYAGAADVYTYFFRRGADLLRQSGLLCFIASNKFMRAEYGGRLRAFLKRELPPLAVLDFGRTGTFDATVRPVVVLARKGGGHEEFRAATMRGADGAMEPAAFMEERGFAMPRAALSDTGWALAEPALLKLRAKIEAAGTPLREYLDEGFYRGVTTGLNAAFVIDEDTRQALVDEDPASADLIRPWLRGRDVRRWRADWKGLHAIATASSANADWPWSGAKTEADALAVFRKTYPSIHRHLSQFEGKLRRRQDKGRFFWELRSCAYYQAFARPKIVYPEIATEMRAFRDPKGHLTGNTCYILPTDDVCLLAILNSRLLDFWFRLAMPCLDDPFDGGDMRFLAADTQHTPIAPAKPAAARRLAALADRIQSARQSDPAADTTPQEREIDQTVFTLYGLDQTDIATIDRALSS